MHGMFVCLSVCLEPTMDPVIEAKHLVGNDLIMTAGMVSVIVLARHIMNFIPKLTVLVGSR